MNNIFILDGQTDEVLGHINKEYIIDNEHEKDLPTHKDYFQFTVLADNKHAEHLTKRNGLIIPGEDGEFLEFRIFESIKYRDNEGLFIEAYALATYLDLKNQKIFDQHKTNSETALQHTITALDGTEWQVGNVEFKGVRTLDFDSPFNSYDYILRIAREFELEPRFYIETDGNKITGRYVDLVERVGEFRGRTIEFGRDLQSIRRKEDTSEVVTALWVYGPQREDGTRLKVFVEDDEARQRWGRRGQHIIDYYEPQTENQDITEERLETLGNMELNKRINAVVTYEADIVDLENVPGLENKKIRFGDTIRIKDTKFNPPLYVEARVFNVKRDVFNKANKTVQLGDFVEYTEEEVQAIWKLLQQQIQQKISAVQAEQMIEGYAEPKKVESPTPPQIDSEGDNPIWIDTSKEPHVPHIVEQGQWVKVVPTEAEEVNAYNKSEIDTITSDLEDGIQQAMATADGKNTVFRQSNTPPTTNRKIGDLWFKTDEGNKMFVWTGEWTETKLDYQALSVGKLSAISADLGDVTAGSITGVTMNLANGKFVVDENGNASFGGTVSGAEIIGSIFTQDSTASNIRLDDEGLTVTEKTHNEKIHIGIKQFGGHHGGDYGIYFVDPNDDEVASLTHWYDETVLKSDSGLVLEGGDFGVQIDGSSIQGADYGVRLLGGLGSEEIYSRVVRNFYTKTDTFRNYQSGVTEVNGSNNQALWLGQVNTSIVEVRTPELRLASGSRRLLATSLRTEQNTNTLIQPFGSNEVLVINANNQYRPIRASSFPTGSLAEFKTDIKEWNGSAIDIVYNNATIYEYRLKDDMDKLRYGLVIGDGYNTPEEVIDGDGVEQYLMNSISWKAIQEITQILIDKGIIDEKDIKL